MNAACFISLLREKAMQVVYFLVETEFTASRPPVRSASWLNIPITLKTLKKIA